jgi:hypothetical protein
VEELGEKVDLDSVEEGEGEEPLSVQYFQVPRPLHIQRAE